MLHKLPPQGAHRSLLLQSDGQHLILFCNTLDQNKPLQNRRKTTPWVFHIWGPLEHLAGLKCPRHRFR